MADKKRKTPAQKWDGATQAAFEIEFTAEDLEGMLEYLEEDTEVEVLVEAEYKAQEVLQSLQDQVALREMVDRAKAVGKIKEFGTALLKEDGAEMIRILSLDSEVKQEYP